MTISVELPPDPNVFYATVAQVSISLVAFQGGFFIMQLQSLTQQWRTLRLDLERLQAEEFASRVSMLAALKDGDQALAAVSRSHNDECIRGLTPLWAQRDRARLPLELAVQFAVLAFLTAVGVWHPITLMTSVDQQAQISLLGPVISGIAALWFVMIAAAINALRDLKRSTSADYEAPSL